MSLLRAGSLIGLAGGAAAGGLLWNAWQPNGGGHHSSPEIAFVDVAPVRQEQLRKLRQAGRDNPFDVLIVGGGATGTGCAVDSATR